MRYVWQRLNKANHNHYSCEVFEKSKPDQGPVWNRHFDGTQAQALEHFTKEPNIKRYMNERYNVFVRGNSIQLNWKDD